MNELLIVEPLEQHRDRWNALYAAYAEFYRVDQTSEMRDRVWCWIHDPNHELEALLATKNDGQPIGLAHFRNYIRPLTATTGGFLDDLFVEPDERRTGVATALINAVADVGRERGWSVLRWITRADNDCARGLP